MDYKYIEQLLERYWECETTLEEEDILRTFFSQKDVPAGLQAYKELFCYEQSEAKKDVLGDDFDVRMMALIDEPKPVKARTISIAQRFMPLFKAAAIVAIFLTLGNAAQVTFKDNSQPVDVAGVQKPKEGPSVAMSDSMKTDTIKKVPASAVILK
ncbi:MAG: pyruvate ferredoxin oxidoreductase [Prevotellaceae bacterium]|nr:pyruvate ferredoxin oxidoreductase [Prevotellaceae bacterium]